MVSPLTYELAKELKDAGFPFIQWRTGTNTGNTIAFGRTDADIFLLPTLSELITACGDEFECLYRIVNLDKTTDYFRAHAFGQDRGLKLEGETLYADCSGKGSSPEEAVARLWLVLNKK